MPDTAPAVTLYTDATPNGKIASVGLELLHVPYRVHRLDISTGVQKEDWFLKISPNGRIPAIVDHRHGDFSVFESGAILLWLVQNYDPNHTLWPTDPKAQSQVMQWVMFEMGGIGPMQGQPDHFIRFDADWPGFEMERFMKETRRLYTVLNRRLQGRTYLVGDRLTIADVINFCWVVCYKLIKVDLSDQPDLRAWMKRILAMPEVRKGLQVPPASASLQETIDNYECL
ncbi:Glutathione S-transferase 2 [Tieghemiomyces parasiticus]|uniref:Glutathione S-transferase 2 n=1 Tax=Tieghemiomyces parasiticus TaxID=78921 RepID=A0A9W7ZQ07_9FUNG|nr:Glutathione S-transferase 2 [Tieghemiomyces parasiticus]